MEEPRRNASLFSLGLTFVFGLALASPLLGAPGHWPQWRGPRRDGVSDETGLLKSWPAEGPKLVWKAIGAGEGYSTVAVTQGKVFTQGKRGETEHVIAYGEETGKEAWSRQNGPGLRSSRGHGPRGTPTVDGEKLYALSGKGRLICLEAASGKEVWHHDLVAEYRGSQNHWGISESPLVLKDRVLVNAGGKGASIIAFKKDDGQLLWKKESDPAGYSSGISADFEGVPQVVFFTEKAAMGLSPADGQVYWRYPRANNGTANIATPICSDGHVFLSSAYGTGCALLKLEKSGDRLDAKEVYFKRDMQNHHSSCVLVGGHLYGFSNAKLTCMEFKTGKWVWNDESVGKGSLVYADGRLYCLSEDGVMGLVEAIPEGYREKGRFKIQKKQWPTWAHPVMAGGRLYLRNQDEILCYDMRDISKS